MQTAKEKQPKPKKQPNPPTVLWYPKNVFSHIKTKERFYQPSPFTCVCNVYLVEEPLNLRGMMSPSQSEADDEPKLTDPTSQITAIFLVEGVPFGEQAVLWGE